MDLFDVLKACIRWSVLVAAIIGVGVWQADELASEVDVSYEVTSESLFIGPTRDLVATAEDGVLIEQSANPFLRFSSSLEITSSALTAIVDGDEYRQQIFDEGFSGTYEIGVRPGAPSIQVIGEALSPEATTALTVRVTNGIADEMQRLQNDAEVPELRRINLQQLAFSEPTELAGDRLRVFAGVIAVSIAAAMALAVGLDTLLALRRRRRLLKANTPGAANAVRSRRLRMPALRPRSMTSAATPEIAAGAIGELDVGGEVQAESTAEVSEDAPPDLHLHPDIDIDIHAAFGSELAADADSDESDDSVDTDALDDDTWRTGPIGSRV